jgi:hypothetical protein
MLQIMLANLRDGFLGDYGVRMKPAKLWTFCEVEWPTFNVGWPTEGTLDLATIAHVRDIVIGDPGHPDQFPYIDSWYILAAYLPDWLHFQASQKCTAILVNGKVKEKKFEVHHTSEPEPPDPPSYVLLVCPAAPASLRSESNSEDPNGKEKESAQPRTHVIQQLPHCISL